MAKQELLDGETRLSFRTKLNNMFTEVYNYISSISTTLSSHTSSITTINSTLTSLDGRVIVTEAEGTSSVARLTALENTGITQVGLTTTLASVNITTTPTKLSFFDSIPLQVGTKATASVVNQDITINVSGNYVIAGNIIADFPQTDLIKIQLYKNGVAATPSFSQQGLGTGKPINIGYHMVIPLVTSDVLTIYATSGTATFACIISASAVIFEKTDY